MEVPAEMDFGKLKMQGEFKDNTVQEILKESVENDGTQIFEQNRQLTTAQPSQISQITENLFLCSAALVNEKLLERLGVTCIITAAPELPNFPLQNKSIIYRKVPVADSNSSNIFQYFDEVADLIHKTSEAGSKSLVYCVAGVSRSASLCIAYLMRHCGLTLLEAYNHVKDRRPRIKPNCSFFRQLIEYEEQLRSLQTVSMVFCDAVQMEIPSVYESDYKFACPFRKKLGERNGRY